MELPSPSKIKIEFPISKAAADFIAESRETAKEILCRKDERLVAVIGPCSIHEPASVLEYAKKLKKLSLEIGQSLFPILRFFIEKSRTRLGWKGLLYDPKLDGSNDISEGLKMSRKLFTQIAELRIPCAVELLEPLVAPYFDDLIVWGMIGARTSASQPHRQMASGLPFPVGFKNDIHGELDVAISGILSSRTAHSHIGINGEGRVSAIQTRGNLFSHLVLRGAENHSNYDAVSVAKALRILHSHQLETGLVIDCAHGNSGKDPKKQRIVLESLMEQIREGNKSIAGFMVESHLFAGKQPLLEEGSLLRYGVSITDPCLGLDETESLLRWAADRSISMSSVQK